MADASQPFPFTVVASIVRSRGVRGEMVCELLTDFPEKFAERRKLFLLSADDVEAGRWNRARETTLEDFWMPTGKSAGRIVLKLAGCDTMDEADKLRGMAVAIRREERAQLNEGEFFTEDLEGCEVVTATAILGRVIKVDTVTTGSALLVVQDASGAEVLIPLVKAYLVNVDLAAKRIVMELPDGLVEVNRPEPKANLKNGQVDEAGSSFRSE
jgi:16S rRNA processing protein RimM